jgi:hypothetical protein
VKTPPWLQDDYWAKMPDPVDEIRTMTDVVELGISCRLYWFRGHPKLYKQLEPSIFRQDVDMLRMLTPEIEGDHVLHFQRLAPAYMERPPANDDYVTWLLYMQHYGCPTRLLDWTESVLCALYFAVSDDKHSNENGELWVLNPDRLIRKAAGVPSRLTYYAKQVRIVASNVLCSDIQLLENEFGITYPKGPVAFLPPAIFPRLIAQTSAFTIHPTPQAGRRLSEICGIQDCSLSRYLIPSDSKRELCKALNALGTSRRSLFPDLDSLSITLIRDSKTIDIAREEFPTFKRGQTNRTSDEGHSAQPSQ